MSNLAIPIPKPHGDPRLRGDDKRVTDMTFSRRFRIPAFGFLRAEPLGERVAEYTAKWRLKAAMTTGM